MEQRISELEKQSIKQQAQVEHVENEFNMCRDEVFKELRDFALILKENTMTTEKTCDAVTSMAKVWNAGQGFMTVGKWIGKFALWCSAISGFIWLVWYILANGHIPPPSGH